MRSQEEVEHSMLERLSELVKRKKSIKDNTTKNPLVQMVEHIELQMIEHQLTAIYTLCN